MKEQSDYEDGDIKSFSSSSDKKKTFANKAVALGAGAILLAAGCDSNKTTVEKTSPQDIGGELEQTEVLPVEKNEHFDEIEGINLHRPVEEKIENIEFHYFGTSPDYYNNYKYKFSPEVVDKLKELSLEDGEPKEYPLYQLKASHEPGKISELMDNFTKELNLGEDDRLFYRNREDVVTLILDEPAEIPGVKMNVDNVESIENGLKVLVEKYFDKKDYNFKVLDIKKGSEDFYLVDAVRVEFDEKTNLELPHRRYGYSRPLVLNSEGKIKAFELSLIELEKVPDFKTKLVSVDELVSTIGTSEYRKLVKQDLPKKLHPIFISQEGTTSLTGKEEGKINIGSVETVIYVESLDQGGVGETFGTAPVVFVFEGKGTFKDPYSENHYASDYLIFGNAWAK